MLIPGGPIEFQSRSIHTRIVLVDAAVRHVLNSKTDIQRAMITGFPADADRCRELQYTSQIAFLEFSARQQGWGKGKL